MKTHYEAVYYTGGRWGLYGKRVIDRTCGHRHRTAKAAIKCQMKDEINYNGIAELEN